MREEGLLVTGLAEISGSSSEAMDRSVQRFSARRKAEVVLRLLRGEDIELLSRELGITVASLTKWRDKFLMAGIEAMKKKPLDEKDREVVRLREKVGDPCCK